MQSILKKVVGSLVGGLLLIASASIIWGIHTREHYLAAFEQTRNGDTLAQVLERFGQPSHIEPHLNVPGYDAGGRSACGESCALRLWYELPFTLGTSPVSVDFNSAQVAIDKYQWSSP